MTMTEVSRIIYVAMLWTFQLKLHHLLTIQCKVFNLDVIIKSNHIIKKKVKQKQEQQQEQQQQQKLK